LKLNCLAKNMIRLSVLCGLLFRGSNAGLPKNDDPNPYVMTGPFDATTALNYPNCDLSDPSPGTRSSTCVVNATLSSYDECASSCLSSAECTACTWHQNVTDNGVWSMACVFRLDNQWEPEYNADYHTSGQKVIPKPPLVWPFSNGFAKLQTMWFGANSSGLDNQDTLALISKHNIGMYGWQQGTRDLQPGQNLGDGDAYLSAAGTHLSDYLSLQPGQNSPNRTLVGVYRQIQVALRLFAAPRAAADNAAMEAFWMKDSSTGVTCVAGQPWGTLDPFWNFSNTAAGDYWVNEVIGQVASESSFGITSVFFDESDQNYCGYWNSNNNNCGAFPLETLASMQTENNAVLARTAAALNAVGIIPIFSMLNRFAASTVGLENALSAPCSLPEDETAAALAKVAYARFYENFPYTWWTSDPQGPDQAAAFVSNAIIEGQNNIPVVLHYDVTVCPSSPRNITRPGRLGGDMEVQLALFLIVQTNQTVFSISGNWYDPDFCWHSEFDVLFGTPLGDATRTGPHSWTRNFTLCNVAVDVSSYTGEIDLL
jgi:hypothetical protein